MDPHTYVFGIKNGLTFVDLMFLFGMARHGTEGIHGPSTVGLGDNCWIENDGKTCVIDASTAIGLDMARIFYGILTGVLGEECISVDVEQGGAS